MDLNEASTSTSNEASTSTSPLFREVQEYLDSNNETSNYVVTLSGIDSVDILPFLSQTEV